MKVLFVHQNFPGQYLHLARHLAGDPANEVVAITQRKDVSLPGMRIVAYAPSRKVTSRLHHYLADMESGVLNGQQVARAALQLRDAGFVPDVMVGHNGWGEIWFLKDVYPAVPLLGYFEFFYRLQGSDVGFDPSKPPSFDDAPRLRIKNAGNLLGLEAADWGQCPTLWQKRQFPLHYQSMLHQVHEGIDTCIVAPDPKASVRLAKASIELNAGDEIVTYVARNLENYRGFASFMRALPHVLDKRSKARVLIVGGDETSYGPKPAKGVTLRQQMLDELGSCLDLGRVHFLGKVPYPSFLKVLQVSMALPDLPVRAVLVDVGSNVRRVSRGRVAYRAGRGGRSRRREWPLGRLLFTAADIGKGRRGPGVSAGTSGASNPCSPDDRRPLRSAVDLPAGKPAALEPAGCIEMNRRT